MPDPRALRIDVGPFHLLPTPDAETWTATARSASGTAAESGAAEGATGRAEITAQWTDWVAFAQRVLRADALWRDVEARGDAWDEGFSAARDAGAVNPYR